MKLVARWAQVVSRQRSEDLPGSGAFWSFIAAGDFARNHLRAQLTFGQIVSGLERHRDPER